jgi:hypothetical protein
LFSFRVQLNIMELIKFIGGMKYTAREAGKRGGGEAGKRGGGEAWNSGTLKPGIGLSV